MAFEDDADPGCRLYLVSPPRLDPERFAPLLASALEAGDVAAFQLRLKEVDDETIRRAIDVLAPVAMDRDVAFILNDRADLAAETGCDGVHLGQSDGSVRTARQLLGKESIIGRSAEGSRHLGMIAAEDGADYVAFGAFFPSPTKPAETRVDAGILAWWHDLMPLPSVAIGGITAENCAPLVHAGADFLAVISAVWDHRDGPAAGVSALNDAIAAAEADA